MPVDDLSDAWAPLRELQAKVRRLERTNPLESASVTSGRVRFIGGLLKIDSGGRLEIEGTLQVDGTTEVTGSFTVSGPWSLTGDGEITGDVDVTGDIDLAGDMNVTGSGRIKIGTAAELTPAVDGGALVFQGDSTQKVYGNGSAVGLRFGSNGINVGATLAALLVGSKSFNVTAAGFTMSGIPTITSAASGGLPVGAMHVSTSGVLSRVIA